MASNVFQMVRLAAVAVLFAWLALTASRAGGGGEPRPVAVTRAP